MGELSLTLLLETVLATVVDVAPIVAVLFFYQLAVLRHAIPRLRRVLVGLIYVVVGLAMFLVGLEVALFPIGKIMAGQLTDPGFLGSGDGPLSWTDYGWVYVFAFAIGFSTTIVVSPERITKE